MLKGPRRAWRSIDWIVEKHPNGKESTNQPAMIWKKGRIGRDEKRETRFGGVANVARRRWRWETTQSKKRTGLVDPRCWNWFRIRIRITRVHIRSRLRRVDPSPSRPHTITPTVNVLLSTLVPLFPLLLLLFPPFFKGSRPFALRFHWKNICAPRKLERGWDSKSIFQILETRILERLRNSRNFRNSKLEVLDFIL